MVAETKSANIFFVQNFIYNLPILKGILQWGFTKYVQQNVQQFEWAFVEIKASNLETQARDNQCSKRRVVCLQRLRDRLTPQLQKFLVVRKFARQKSKRNCVLREVLFKIRVDYDPSVFCGS